MNYKFEEIGPSLKSLGFKTFYELISTVSKITDKPKCEITRSIAIILIEHICFDKNLPGKKKLPGRPTSLVPINDYQKPNFEYPTNGIFWTYANTKNGQFHKITPWVYGHIPFRDIDFKENFFHLWNSYQEMFKSSSSGVITEVSRHKNFLEFWERFKNIDPRSYTSDWLEEFYPLTLHDDVYQGWLDHLIGGKCNKNNAGNKIKEHSIACALIAQKFLLEHPTSAKNKSSLVRAVMMSVENEFIRKHKIKFPILVTDDNVRKLINKQIAGELSSNYLDRNRLSPILPVNVSINDIISVARYEPRA